MADVRAEPGDFTVPLLSGWPVVAAGLVLLVLVVAAVSLLGAARANRDQRAEWQAWLDGRSRERVRSTDPGDRPAEPAA